MQPTQRSNPGLGMTIIEITIVVTMLSLVILGFMVSLDRLLSEARKTGAQANYDSLASSAIDRIEEEVRIASAFNPNISSPYSDPYAPSGGWDYSGSGTTDRVLILSSPATTMRERASTNIQTYQDSVTFNCTSELTYNPAHHYRAILFVDDGILYKRFLTDTTTALCNSQIQKQSCPSSSIGSWPSECRARDEVIARDVSEFAVDYYRSNEIDPMDDAYTEPDTLTDAVAVVVRLTLRQPAGGDPSSATVQFRIARTN